MLLCLILYIDDTLFSNKEPVLSLDITCDLSSKLSPITPQRQQDIYFLGWANISI